MVIVENQLRMSEEGQAMYREGINDYLQVTDQIQMKIATSIKSQSQLSINELFNLLQNAPHILGREASHISNYIKGSFAAFPESPGLSVGEKIPNNLCISNSTQHLYSLQELVQRTPFTILFCGSIS